MKILVTGSRGFVGRNLVSQLHNIRDGKARNYGIAGEELAIYEYDMDSDPAELDVYCRQADFVFNLAGVNRPKDASEFMKGNFGFASTLLDTLKKTLVSLKFKCRKAFGLWLKKDRYKSVSGKMSILFG